MARPLAMSLVPRFVVMMITVFLKSTTRPWLSVRRPSSRICSSELKMSGCAFSTSSKSTTENGFRRTFSGGWPAPPLPGERAALLVADVAGRRAEQPRDGVLLGELAHVELDERVLVAEQELGERLGELGLTDAGGAGEDERSAGTLRVLEACPGAPDGLGQRLDGVVLTDDPLGELVLHTQQPRGLLLGQLEDRDPGRRREDLGDELLVDLGNDVHVAGLPLLLPLGLRCEELLLGVAQGGGLLEVLRVDRALLLAPGLGDLLVELAQVRRSGHPGDPQPGAGLVDEIDRLVRQEPVVDVPVRKRRGGDQRGVGDRDAVVRLVPVAQ